MASTLRGAIADAVATDAEIVLVDVYLHSETGFSIVSALHDVNPRLAILMMSSLDPDEYDQQAAAAAGAIGVLSKSDFVTHGRDSVVRAGLAVAGRSIRR